MAELFSLHVFLWHAFGYEIISFHHGTLRIQRSVFGYGKSRDFQIAKISNLRATGFFGPMMSWRKDALYWGLLGGTVAFDYEGKTKQFGIDLSEDDATQLADNLKTGKEVEYMPLVKVYIREGKTSQYKQALLEAVHHALVNAFNIPGGDRNQMLLEIPPACFYGGTQERVVIEISIFKGRSRDAKRILYRNIVEGLAQNPGINGSDVLIVLNEPPLDNWGIRGGIPASEVNLGFKLDV